MPFLPVPSQAGFPLAGFLSTFGGRIIYLIVWLPHCVIRWLTIFGERLKTYLFSTVFTNLLKDMLGQSQVGLVREGVSQVKHHNKEGPVPCTNTHQTLVHGGSLYDGTQRGPSLNNPSG